VWAPNGQGTVRHGTTIFLADGVGGVGEGRP